MRMLIYITMATVTMATAAANVDDVPDRRQTGMIYLPADTMTVLRARLLFLRPITNVKKIAHTRLPSVGFRS